MYLLVYLVPRLFLKLDNKQELAGTLLENCKNPVHFFYDELICGEFNSSSPYVGEVLRHVHNANQFGLVYLDLIPKNIATAISKKMLN